MIINDSSLDLVFRGFQAVYTDAFADAPTFAGAPAHADKIAMKVNSSARSETYGWLGQFPQLREWVGPRHVHNLKAHKFTILNKTFENTVSVSRNDIDDDNLGVFAPVFAQMGWEARQHPERLVFGLLADGFASECYDGQAFFDTDHPVEGVDGTIRSVSNMQAGTDEPWYLLDTSRKIKPIVWQERQKYEFQSIVATSDSHVFMTDDYLYGVRARVNAGFGLWQLAYASRAPLNAENYALARAAMQSFRGDGGRVLGVQPTTLIVPPSLESPALKLLNSENAGGGETNEWKGTAEPIVTPFVLI